jgi:hypothetical protein
MTTIDRARFITDLSSRPIPARDLGASLGGSITTDEVTKLAGEDRVFNSPKELGALYDHLVAVETQSRARGETGELDRARAVYDAWKPSSDAPLAPLALLTARPRTTGVIAAPLRPMRDSEYVRALGQLRAAQLSDGAARNTTGPEAASRRRILAETNHVEGRVQHLEAQARLLRPGTPERARVEREIDASVRTFEGSIASERTIVAQQSARAAPSDPGSALTRALPGYLGEVAERKGLVIPGVPGSVRPVFTAPVGIVWSGKM